MDGKIDSSTTDPLTDLSNSAPIVLGANHINRTSQSFNGVIDDLRIYDRALSANEIQLLYEAELELPEQSVTSAKLSPALSDLIDGNGSLEQALPAGSVIARKPGEARRLATPFSNAMNITPLSSGKKEHLFPWLALCI